MSDKKSASTSRKPPDPDKTSTYAHGPLANRLAPEVLTGVLSVRELERDLLSATHVCRSWRSALVSAPLLWTRIPCNKPDQTSTYLKRSGSAPIDVVAQSVSPARTADNTALGLITRHPGRVRSMRIFPSGNQTFQAIYEFRRRAPLLQTLYISGFLRDYMSHLPRDFFGGQLPSLRTLFWDDQTFLANPPPPYELFQRSYFGSDASSPLYVALGLISSAPLLERLWLSIADENVPPVPSPPRDMHLDSLRSLDLTSGIALARVIPRFKVPKLRDLKLFLPLGVRGSTSITTLFPSDSYPLLTEVTSMDFYIGMKSSEMKLKGEGVNVMMTKFHPRMDTFFTETPFPLAQITRLRLMGTAEPIAEKTDEFTNLEYLDLSQCVEEAVVLSALSPSSEPGSSVPCPRLVTMEIIFADPTAPIVDSFKQMVRLRKEAGKPLTTIDLSSFDGMDEMLDIDEVNEWLVGAVVLNQ